MNLQQLYYFRTLAEVRHFTRASVKLMVAQPSLSHSINDLEAELGVPLFHRSNREVTLTKYGAFFLEYVSEALSILDTGRLRLHEFASPEQGAISLHYVSSIGPLIPYLVARYYEDTGRKPTFNLKNDTNINIQDSLRAGAADLGLGMKFDDDPGLRTRKLADHDLVLLVSQNHPLAERDSVDLHEIQNERFITYTHECKIRDLIDGILKRLDISPEIVMETVHDSLIYGSVAANLGVALVPVPLGGEQYNVRALRVENEIAQHELFIKWKEIKYIAPAVSEFRDYIIGHPDLFSGGLRPAAEKAT